MATPTVIITLDDTNLAIGQTATVTFTFSEQVDPFSVATATKTAGSGTLGTLSTSDNITFTGTFTPTAAITDTTNVITIDMSQVDDSANLFSGVGIASSDNYVVDGVRPGVAIVFADAALQAGETSLVTFTFDEAVTGFTNADLTIANGTLSAVNSGDGGVTWTATFTPSASTTDATNLITLDKTGVADLSGNAGTGTADSNNYAIDTDRPTATIVVADTSLRIGETSLVTVAFSEAVTGFTNADLTIANGTLSAVSSGDGGVTWTATFTPSASITDATNLITLANTGVSDGAGNAGTGTTDSNNYAIDTARPTATIVVADTALRVGETSLVTVTFSEAVSGFTTADLTVANGGVTGLSSSDGGITWTATLTPTASINDTTNVITLDNTGVADLAGNAGSGTTDSNNYAIDTVRPTATVVVADASLTAGETSLVTITFNEAVTGFTNIDLAVANGALSLVGSADGGVTWTATLTPSASISDTTNVVTLNNTGVSDAAGNTGSGITNSNNYAIDTVRPTATIVVADTTLAVGETSAVTFTFSEAVTGFTNADLTIANGALSAVSSGDGGVTWTATLTPTTATSDTTNVITLDNTGFANAAGNTGAGTTDSNNYAVDTLRPTASIVVADSSLTAGETSLVTVTFNEAVAGFTNVDLTVANGALSAVSSSDGGITWTATLTPSTAISDTTNVVTLDNAGVIDAAGNAGSGTTASNNYAIDTLRPTATIVVADSSLTAGETSLVTVTFSEPVTGFTSADLTVANGAISSLSSGDGGTTWTATLTPTASISDTSNLITLANTGVADAAGNAGTGTTDSNNYAIDTTTAPPPPPPPPPPVTPTDLPGSTTPDVIVGNEMNNTIAAGAGDDTANGGMGDDSLKGDAGDDVLQGNTGNDDLAGGTGDDLVLGGQDNDRVHGNSENDLVSGDKGSDSVHGGQGDDIAYGGEGDDFVFGDLGNDIVRGGQGDDQVFGGDGDDYVSGDRGSDVITGGAGADLFHTFGEAGMDLVTDFSQAEGDRVMLDVGTVYTVSQVGLDTVIDMTDGGQMVLAGVQMSSLAPGWIFAG